MKFRYFTQCILLSFAKALSNIFSRDIFFLTKNLGSWKPIWQLKLIFRATELSEKLKFDISQKVLFCTLASSSNLVLNIVEIATGKYRWKCFYFFLPKVGQLWISHAFSEKKGVKQKRSVILEKNIWRLSNDLAQSFTRSKTGQDFNHHQAMISATSYLAKQLYIHQD